jgi:hypothetical protein
MYRTLLFAVFVLFCISTPASLCAQHQDAVELTRAVIEVERKAIISLNMEFTDEESDTFWPVYNEYWIKMAKLNDRMAKLILGYGKNYMSLSDEKSEEILKDYLDIQSDRLKHRKSYVKKFGKVLPATKVTRFFQVENKLDAIITYELAAEIPLAR